MSYRLGDYVQLPKKRKGHIRYEGQVPSFGMCYGIELDQKDLKNGHDGSVDGHTYFQCESGFGIFIKNTRILCKLQKKTKKKKHSPPTIATDAESKPPPSSTTTTNDENKNGSIKKKRLKSPKKISRSKSPRNGTPKPNKSPRASDKYKRGKLVHSNTPRPSSNPSRARAGTRDPRHKSTRSKKDIKNIPNEYPEKGTNKEKLEYIFHVLATTAKGAGTNKDRDKKIDLIKKATGVINDITLIGQDDMNIENLVTSSYIIKEFKNIFEPLLKNKKYSVHRETLKLFNSLISCEFTRQGMVEQMLFSMKLLTNQLTQNNVKTVNAVKESIKLLIHEVLLEDSNKLLKVIIIELLRFAKTSKKKIIRKYCWLFVADILETKYNIKGKRKLKPPKDVIEGKESKEEEKKDIEEKKEERTIKKRNKVPKAIMDAISVALKIGLNDKDKDCQVQAMKVLNLFSLLEETKADRLISKMSTSTRKLFDSKFGEKKDKRGKKSSLKERKADKAKKATAAKREKDKKNKKKDKDKGLKKRKSFQLKEDPAASDEKEPKKGKKTVGKKGSKKDKKGNKIERTKSPKKKKDDKKIERGKSPKTKDDKKVKTEDKIDDKTEDKTKDKMEDKTDDTIEDKTDDTIEDKTDDTIEDKTEDKTTETVSIDDTEKKTENDVYKLAMDEEDIDEEEVDMDDLRKRRQERRGGSKTRSRGAFGTGDQDFNVTDLSGLGGLVGGDMDDASGSESDESDEDDDDNIEEAGKMNAGMNGDARKETDDDDPYSSSTETYEGDNDIEIYEFPRKDALDNGSEENAASFNIDIDRYLSNNNPEYNWKFGNEEMIFFSHKHNTHSLMSRISQIKRDGDDTEINYDDKSMPWINTLLEHQVDYDDLSLIADTVEFWPCDVDADYIQMAQGDIGRVDSVTPFLNGNRDEDDNPELPESDKMSVFEKHQQHDYILSTQISYNLMRLLTNEHGSDWIKQFIEESIYEITVHALCVFHPLSNGNVYHGRVILEVLLNHFPCDFFKYLVEDNRVIQPLLKYAIFNNIHHGNLNSFVMDLICFDPESIQQRDDILFHQKKKMAQETAEYRKHLLKTVFSKEWKFIESIMKRACSKYCDDVSTKYSVFFVDLVARCASIQGTKCLFEEGSDFIIDSFVNGLLGQDDGKDLNFWQRIRCGQSLVEYLDLASRPTIMDPSIAATPFGFMQAQNAYKDNIFYSSFKQCLARLIRFIPDLCLMISGDDEHNKSPHKLIDLSYGKITDPLGRLKLNALELLTVTIDFHEMNCSVVLREIPLSFWSNIVDMAFAHKYNNMFLCHFRRLVHLAMIFRRRILKHLCVECKMIDRMVDFYQTDKQRSELHGYILQMLNDIYCHDSEIKHIQ